MLSIKLRVEPFSLLAGSGKFATPSFTGVAHGPEFGENRAVVPVGGGIPIAKYYLFDLHMRDKYREILPLLTSKDFLRSSEVFFQNVCDCIECKEVLNGDPRNFTLFGDSNSKPVKKGRIIHNYGVSQTSY